MVKNKIKKSSEIINDNDINKEENKMVTKKITKKITAPKKIEKKKVEDDFEEEDDLLNDIGINEEEDDVDVADNFEEDEDPINEEEDDESESEDEEDDNEENEPDEDDEEDDNEENEPDEDDEEEEKPKKSVKKPKNSKKDEEEDDEEEDDDEEEEKPKKSVKKPKNSKKDEEEDDDDEEDSIGENVSAILKKYPERIGPEKGRRLFVEGDKSIKNSSIRTNYIENLKTFIEVFKNSGFGYIFEDADKKTTIELMDRLYSTFEKSIVTSLRKGDSVAFLNGKINMKFNEGKLYPKIEKSKMTTEVYKLPHKKVNFEGGEFFEDEGFTYSYDGSSELTMAAKDNGDGTITVIEDGNNFRSEGDILNIKTGRKNTEKSTKKTAKKKK